jgi:hypothetical protein
MRLLKESSAADLESVEGRRRWSSRRRSEREAKAIQDKLDRLDEAFLFERSIAANSGSE